MTLPLDSLPDELREFVAAERSRPDPESQVQSRVFARVASTIGFVPGPDDAPSLPDAPATPHAPGLAHMASRISRRGIATFLVGAAVGGAAVGTGDRVRHTSQPPAVAIPAPPVVPSPPPLPEPAPAPAPAPSEPPPTPTAHRTVVVTSAGGTRDKRLEAERKLVEMARTSLARGQTSGALAALRRHQRSFPKGQLTEERDSLWVSALVASGDHAQAREHAARFHRQHPHSLFAPVVDQALRSIP
jgi:hypothetical protein